jgi:RNase_H superfamily
MDGKQKVLVLDIETAPMTVFVWQLKDQYVDLKQLKTDWYIIAWGAKWLGDPPAKLIYRSQQHAKNPENDKVILRELWHLLDKADVVLTQNGAKFDIPKIKARLILQGFRPPRPFKQCDVYKELKKVASFTSHSLEYITHKVCRKYKKLTDRKFTGLSLWRACMEGNKAAWAEMKRYNIHDVLSLEEKYLYVRAWLPESTVTSYNVEKSSVQCKICGEKGHMIRRGVAVKNKFKYQRWQCQTCGGWATGDKLK